MNAQRAGVASVLLLSALLVAACGETGLQVVRARLVIDRTEVAFGDRSLLDDATQVVTLTNTGKAPLDFTVAFKGANERSHRDFSIDLTNGSLDGGASAELRVRFRPRDLADAGACDGPDAVHYCGTLTVTTADDAGGVQTLAVTGAATTRAAVETAPAALDFGRVGEGRTVVRRLRLTSRGTAPLRIGSLKVSASDKAAYSIFGSSGSSGAAELDPHVDGRDDAFVDLTVSFAPTADRLETEGTLELTTNDPAHEKIEVPLTATINRKPVADAGADRPVAPGSLVELDGSRSTDPDGDLPLKYQWSSEFPRNSKAVLSGADGPNPSFVPEVAGDYVVQLVVTDAAGLESRPVRVTVTAVTSDGLRVELTWNQTPANIADLDLHVLRPGDALDGPDDCFGDNPAPDWGVPFDVSDDPRHGGDKLVGFGPEVVAYAKPPDRTYRIVVRYAKTNSPATEAPVEAVVRVRLYGTVRTERSLMMSRAGELWEVGSVDWPSGAVTP
ncbi:MAG: hypothetical protein RL199_1274 [Pseudomonadota bacterium]|jgi:hypothetical protein